MFSSSFTAVIVISVITLSFSAEIPNLKPGDRAPPFMIQARKADQYDTLEILKYGTNDSNIQGPIVFLAHTKRSGFLESLFSDPECFNKLLDISPDNVNYVFCSTPILRQQLATMKSKQWLTSLQTGFTTPLSHTPNAKGMYTS